MARPTNFVIGMEIRLENIYVLIQLKKVIGSRTRQQKTAARRFVLPSDVA